YLRLHLLSHRLVVPNALNLEGLFGMLTNVVWTSEGPCTDAGFEETRLRLIAAGRTPTVLSLDRFPRMVDYVLPTGVRIGTRTGCAWARTWPRAPPSCTRAS